MMDSLNRQETEALLARAAVFCLNACRSIAAAITLSRSGALADHACPGRVALDLVARKKLTP
jgi:Tfp pilus assembly protein FimT